MFDEIIGLLQEKAHQSTSRSFLGVVKSPCGIFVDGLVEKSSSRTPGFAYLGD